MNVIRYLKQHFFTPSSTEDRFLEGDVPTESTYRQLFNSIPFVKERSDRAKLYGEKDPQGLVVKNTSEHVKTRINPNDLDCNMHPYSYAIDAENLPTVESGTTTASVADADSVGLRNVSGIDVTEDNSKRQKSTTWIVRISTSFLNALASKFADLYRRVAKLENSIFSNFTPPYNVQFGINGVYNIRHLKNSPHFLIETSNVTEVPGFRHKFRLSDQLISYFSENIPHNTEETALAKIEGVFVREVVNNAPRAAITEFIRVSSDAKRYVRCPENSNVTKIKTVSLGTELHNDAREILLTQFAKYQEVGTLANYYSLGEGATYIQIGKFSSGFVFGMMDPITPCAFRANLRSVLCEGGSGRNACGQPLSNFAANLMSFRVSLNPDLQNSKLEVIFTKPSEGMVRLYKAEIPLANVVRLE